MFSVHGNSAAELERAIESWTRLADEESARPSWDRCAVKAICDYRANVYRRTVEALRIQLETGVAHCSCCLKPIGDDKPYWMRSTTND